jgi:hypothetical protein
MIGNSHNQLLVGFSMVRMCPNVTNVRAKRKALSYKAFATCTFSASASVFHGNPIGYVASLNGGGPQASCNFISRALLHVPHGNPMCQATTFAVSRKYSRNDHASVVVKSIGKTFVEGSCLFWLK